MNQNDFRKLLATPRPNSGAKAPPTTTQAKKPPSIDSSSSSSNNQFAKPTAVVKNKKKKEWKRPDETESNLPKFRDRAKERREGINIDYKDSEEIIQRLSEIDSNLEDNDMNIDKASMAYEQSKYLGGDMDHTHLVKGLDFALLNKVRHEIETQKSVEESEKNAQEYMESVHGSLSEDSVPKFLSKLAEEIYNTAIIKAKQPPPLKNDMFQAGRMAFLWYLDDTKTSSGMDPNVPTTIIRSLSEVKDDTVKRSTADSSIVVEKVAKILERVRFGGHDAVSSTTLDGMTAGERKEFKKKEREERLKAEKEKEMLEREKASKDSEVTVDAADDDEDIFADVGRDYVLEARPKSERLETESAPSEGIEATSQKNAKNEYFKTDLEDAEVEDPGAIVEAAAITNSIFMKPKDALNEAQSTDAQDDGMDMFMDDLNDDEDKAPNTSKKPTSVSNSHQGSNALNSGLETLLQQGASMLNELEGAGTAEKILIERPSKQKPAGISLSKSALTNYGEEDAQLFEYYDSDEFEEEDEADLTQVDMGVRQNKQRQKTRYDFETEDEWVLYKESQVHIPKAAFQFGVKSSDGRLKGKAAFGGVGADKKRKEDAKLNREFQQLDKMMGEKYGDSLGGNGGGASGKNRAERRAQKRANDEGSNRNNSNKKKR